MTGPRRVTVLLQDVDGWTEGALVQLSLDVLHHF